MEVEASVLTLHFSSVNLHIHLLIMQFISLGEAVSRGNVPEVCHHPNILQQLDHSIGTKLMQLHLKFQQDVEKQWVWGILRQAVKNSSKTTASSEFGSGTVSSPGSWPIPLAK
jgi:hypothetical protein